MKKIAFSENYFKYFNQKYSMMKETPEQLQLEAEIKSQAQVFLKDFNANIPESMELEYEGFYRRGFFVTKKSCKTNPRSSSYGITSRW